MAKKVKVPKDVVSSGRSDSQCYAHYFGATRDEVEKKRKRYFQEYHPHGYGTHTKGIFEHPSGHWYCYIARYHSCD